MVRADALATLYLFHPLRKLSSQTTGIPILMYHSVSGSTEACMNPYYRTVTTPDVFARHMKHLHENGYSTINLGEAVSCLEQSRHTCQRSVVITFDDGYQDFYSEAFPVLNKYGFSATVYLPSAYIGRIPKEFKGIECLTWSHVRELKALGVEFGSHTVTHPQLKSLASANIGYEVRTSKDAIEQELGCAVTSFAYPYAFPETDRSFTKLLRELLDQAGYQNGVSTIIGTADGKDDRLFMKRLPVNSCDDCRLFKAKLEGAYDWLHLLQYSQKLLNHRIFYNAE